MISCIEWIPKGVADPNPKRYELSKAERELLEQNEENDSEEVGSDEEDMESEEEEDDAAPENTKVETPAADLIASQPVDPSSLPADLRMDDYSDDEDDTAREKDIGSLLIANEANTGLGIDEDGNVEDEVEEDVDQDSDQDSEDDEDEDFDDMDDIPDTREFMASDVKGLEAMSFAGYSGQPEFNIEEDDDDSDVDDTNLQPQIQS